ncbi:MAG: hypothetical protein V1656_02100, partial [Candidatus Jorgensenbacteria bacterium]
GYHLELEIVVNDVAQKEDAEKKIFALAEELSVKIMTNQELLEFTQAAEAEYKKKNGKMKIVKFAALTKEEARLLKKAQEVAKKSASDLGHQIGCLIRCKNGEEYTGATNIRTRTIGSTCAERMALDQMYFHKNVHPKLCVLIGKLPETNWRLRWSERNICTPCGVCLETMRQTIRLLRLKDIDFLCSSWDKKGFCERSFLNYFH